MWSTPRPDVLQGHLARLCLLLGSAVGALAQSSPRVPGLLGPHPLGEQETGELLFGELGCANCHTSDLEGIGTPLTRPTAPRLDEAGGRVEPGYLARFIADPQGTQPGTRMPDVLGQLPPSQRAQVALDLTHFLVSRASRSFNSEPVSTDEAQRKLGEGLFHRVGCVACHGSGAAGPVADLAHVPAKYSPDSLSAFLFQPLHARPGGRMPDMGLDRDEAGALASYLLNGARPLVGPFQVDPQRAAAGRLHFQELGCAACHTGLGLPTTLLAQDRASLRPGRGCLVGEGPARFGLAPDQRAALEQALAGQGPEPHPSTLARSLTAFNCIACHKWGEFGGAPEPLLPHFQTTEFELGDEARLPPDLEGVGAKLTRGWLEQVLFDGASVRPYMLTRMPRYGTANLAHLPDLFEAADPAEEVTLREPKSKWKDEEWQKVARAAGRELLGNEGLACVLCHDFNSHASPGKRGLDLISSPDRLRPAWFMDFLVAPEKLRPGIVMPQSWPDGKAAHQGILDGDTRAQLEAIWLYLSLGRSAADPPGIRTQGANLEVGARVRTYRGRSNVAGFRGIAVGYPEGLSYAFNAQNGSLSALWRGEFISVNWNGQAAGNFNPKGRAVRLSEDVTFCRLEDASQDWPRAPHMNAEQPVNPDPRYARNLGYRFRGYYMGELDTPTFMYSSGSVELEDTSRVLQVEGRPVLRRELRLVAPEAETLYMRVLTGDIEEGSPTSFQTAELRVSLPTGETLLRRGRIDPEQEGEDPGKPPLELLLKLSLDEGTTTLTLDYELLH
ncbi:MAG TPA: c-type cytochrome [Planctomycetota bacterium]|jgi:mono/diheme cytochrome c family protein|nr:c-type cytochrome [Planctomycetota bacterium]